MAAVESLSSADPFEPAQWLVLRGTLRDADLIPLLARTTAAGPGDVTLDLLSLGHLTSGGCWTIRNLAEDLWRRGRRLSVVFRPGSAVADELHSTGTIGHRYTVFLASALDDAELAGRTRDIDQPIVLLDEARSPTQQLEIGR